MQLPCSLIRIENSEGEEGCEAERESVVSHRSLNVSEVDVPHELQHQEPLVVVGELPVHLRSDLLLLRAHGLQDLCRDGAFVPLLQIEDLLSDILYLKV
ncbi:hypothetical protein SDC9_131894 [bioreactor metagenome]|uniref:Uncharacterized protein n=1 Tax=bioreactor metagenome TaxID=1076179 RepID=A0A645D6Y6_9ZZZZ